VSFGNEIDIYVTVWQLFASCHDITSKSLFDLLLLSQKGAVYFGLNRLFGEGGTPRVGLQVHLFVGPETSILIDSFRAFSGAGGGMIGVLVNQ